MNYLGNKGEEGVNYQHGAQAQSFWFQVSEILSALLLLILTAPPPGPWISTHREQTGRLEKAAPHLTSGALGERDQWTLSPTPGPATWTPCGMDFRLPAHPVHRISPWGTATTRSTAAPPWPWWRCGPPAGRPRPWSGWSAGWCGRSCAAAEGPRWPSWRWRPRPRWARPASAPGGRRGGVRRMAEPRPGCRPHPGPRAYLGARDEGDADGELAPHPATQKPAPGVLLLLQPERVQHAFDLLRALLTRQAFQLKRRGWRSGRGFQRGRGPPNKHFACRAVPPYLPIWDFSFHSFRYPLPTVNHGLKTLNKKLTEINS